MQYREILQEELTRLIAWTNTKRHFQHFTFKIKIEREQQLWLFAKPVTSIKSIFMLKCIRTFMLHAKNWFVICPTVSHQDQQQVWVAQYFSGTTALWMMELLQSKRSASFTQTENAFQNMKIEEVKLKSKSACSELVWPSCLWRASLFDFFLPLNRFSTAVWET